MVNTFVPVSTDNLLSSLQDHASALPSSIDSFLEDHILASTHYQIVAGNQSIGWASIHGGSLITQFVLLPPFRAQGQRVFAQVKKLENVQAAFVPTCDEFFLAHALDEYRLLEKQAYFFQHDRQRPRFQCDLPLTRRPATVADLPAIQQHSGDFLDKLDQRLADGQIFLCELAGDFAGVGISEAGRLCRGVASIGMFTAEAQRGRGIGAAILTHLIDVCAQRQRRPVAGCWYYNHRSKKTLEKAGMFTQTRLLKVSF